MAEEEKQPLTPMKVLSWIPAAGAAVLWFAGLGLMTPEGFGLGILCYIAGFGLAALTMWIRNIGDMPDAPTQAMIDNSLRYAASKRGYGDPSDPYAEMPDDFEPTSENNWARVHLMNHDSEPTIPLYGQKPYWGVLDPEGGIEPLHPKFPFYPVEARVQLVNSPNVTQAELKMALQDPYREVRDAAKAKVEIRPSA